MNKFLALLLTTPLFLASCGGSDEDITPSPTPTPTPGEQVSSNKGHFFLSVATPQGQEYILQAEEIEGKTLRQKDNIMELPNVHYTWVFRGKTAIGMSYQQSNPGVGYAMTLKNDLTLNKIGEFLVRHRFTNYEFLDDTTFVTTVAGLVKPDGSRTDGATFDFWTLSNGSFKLSSSQTVWTNDITKNGQQVTFSGLIGLGDGTFLTSMVESDYHAEGETGGSSVGTVAYPDSCWVVRMDKNLKVLNVYADNRQSYSAGRYRAQMFRQLLKTDDGTVYAFSNAYETSTTKRAGALRILKGATTFDPSYDFNIQAKTDNYKFRRVWYLKDHKFLLELYNTYTLNMTTPGHQFAIVDMQSQSVQWLQGIPAKSEIISGSESGGVPMYHNNYIYLPITVIGEDATIYKVDVATGQASKITTIQGAQEIRSIGYLQ